MNAELRQAVPFDWKNPDYAPIYQQRIRRLAALRANPGTLPALKLFYGDHIAQYISDWGVTFDPRNVERGLPSTVPFILMPRQIEWVDWLIDHWRAGKPGLVEKSRESGMSWLGIAVSCALCLFYDGIVIGWGSRKEEYVDQKGAPKSLFEKARFFLAHQPPEFLQGWNRDKHAPHMRILFPGTGSAMTGECGDSIGRGDRTSIFFVDESAFLEHAALADASLSQTTRCRIDISTPNGMGNPFAQKRHQGRIDVFTFSWLDDRRKGPEWYLKQHAELDPVTLAQEVDISYTASVEGIVIPQIWVQSAIDAHRKLGITPSGMKFAAFDVADGGQDLCAFAGRHGFLLMNLHSWSGKASDIFASTTKALGYCDHYGYGRLTYDADGLGAGVSGDSRVINAEREAADKARIFVEPFRGSAAVDDPEGQLIANRLNVDVFANRKSQGWFQLRHRFQKTHAAIAEGKPFDPDEIISIDPALPELTAVLMELSQPTFSVNSVGKFLIQKTPDGCRSPNLADAVMYAFQGKLSVAETWERLGQ